MKKLLLTLTLLLTLGFAASAETKTLELTQQVFKADEYSAASIENVQDGLSFAALAYNTNGYQFNSGRGCFFMVSGNTNNFTIKSVTIKFYATNSSAKIKVYKSDDAYTAQNESAVAGSTLVQEQAADSKEHTFEINAPYFGIVNSGTKALQMTYVKVEYEAVASTVCAEPIFSVADGAEVFAGQTISVNKGNATTCELLVNNEPQTGLSYTIPETAEIGTTIILTANSTLEGGDPDTATATINVTVIEKPVYVMFDYAGTFSNWNIGTANNIIDTKETATIDGVTMTVEGRHITIKDSSDLRIYKAASGKAAGKITLSVPAGFYLTNVVIDGENLNNTDASDNWTNSDKTVNSYVITASGSAYIKSIKVYYAAAEPETKLVGFTHEESFGKTQARMNYMLHLNNHKDTNVYTVVLTVNGVEFPCTEHTDASIVEETANAPMRVLNPNDVESETTLKGSILATGLEGEREYPASVSVKLGDKELHSEAIENFKTGTTGIEDVTVENEAAAEYFNLQGVRVAEPQAGQIYIVRRGAKATKELVK